MTPASRRPCQLPMAEDWAEAEMPQQHKSAINNDLINNIECSKIRTGIVAGAKALLKGGLDTNEAVTLYEFG